MRQKAWQMMSVLVALGGGTSDALATDDLAPCWRGLGGSTYQQWLFEMDANPAAPETSTNAYGGAQASIVVGTFGTGWQQQLLGFGTRTGYWDLGRTGSVSLIISNNPDPVRAVGRYVRVQVIQWHDSGIFSQYAAVSIPRATRLENQRVVVENTGLGDWMLDQTTWRLESSPASDAITVVGTINGSIIDEIVVESICLICPQDLLATAEVGQCSKSNVTWTASALDICTVTNVACTPPNGGTFLVGTTMVRCLAMDAWGNTNECAFQVTVDEAEARPLRLSIQRLSLTNNLVQVCWPLGCVPYTLEQTSDLNDPGSWMPVGASVAIDGDRNCVTTEASEQVRWYRLKEPAGAGLVHPS